MKRPAPAVFAIVRLGAAALLIGAAPASRVMAIHQGFGARGAGVVAATVFTVVAVRRISSPWMAWGGVALASVVAAASGGRIVGAWFAASAVVTLLLVLDARWGWPPSLARRLADRAPIANRHLVPPLVATWWSARMAGEVDRLHLALALGALAGLVLAVVRLTERAGPASTVPSRSSPGSFGPSSGRSFASG